MEESYDTLRRPLGQILFKSNQQQNNKIFFESKIQTKALKNSQNLNQYQRRRMIELKNKYQNIKEPVSQRSIKLMQGNVQKSNYQQIAMQQSFKQIEVGMGNIKEKESIKFKTNKGMDSSSKLFSSSKQSEVSYLCESFSKKVQQSDQRMVSKISNLQSRIYQLKQYQNDKNYFNKSLTQDISSKKSIQTQKTDLIQADSKFIEKRLPFNSIKEKNNNQFQQKPSTSRFNQHIDIVNHQSQYVKQLKSKNFIEEIKRKINQIESQRKSNIQNKILQISTASNTSLNSKNIQQTFSQTSIKISQSKEKPTLKSLTPYLAESQVIELTQRNKQTDKENSKFISQYSTVVNRYHFIPGKQTLQTKNSQLFNSQLKERSQKDQQQIKQSPSLLKKSCLEQILEETHLVQRNSLQGQALEIQQKTQKQFTLLINRLAYQAQIDNNFSTQLFKYNQIFSDKNKTLTNIIIDTIHQYSQQNNIDFDQKIYTFSQIEIDPLLSAQKTHKQFSVEQINKMAFKLKKHGDRISSFFNTKIYCHFNLKTVNLLIEELQKCHQLTQNQSFNVGHLTSYINMRTGKNLRNRFFYRIMKRILKSSQSLSLNFNKQNLIESLVNKNLQS